MSGRTSSRDSPCTLGSTYRCYCRCLRSPYLHLVRELSVWLPRASPLACVVVPNPQRSGNDFLIST
ncbi:hypothetical protein DBV15_06854 [Temnothorax longispinosus]|uniref:Uncharacterized protein n=1 Tax=Temnothorax longispinosus TaxID=300112 RepID=A0A4S2KCC9_9HYME|nr:hypothetical protein DBV15_06854 [Temnothorax longispinosus]